MVPPERFPAESFGGLIKNFRVGAIAPLFPELEATEGGLQDPLQPRVRGVDFLCP